MVSIPDQPAWRSCLQCSPGGLTTQSAGPGLESPRDREEVTVVWKVLCSNTDFIDSKGAGFLLTSFRGAMVDEKAETELL